MIPRFLMLLTAASCGAAEVKLEINFFPPADVKQAAAGEKDDDILPVPAGMKNLIFTVPSQAGRGVLAPDDEPQPKAPDGKLPEAVVRRILEAELDKKVDAEKEKEASPAEPAGKPLSAEDEKSLREMVEKIGVERRRILQEGMRKTVLELTGEIKPDAEAAAKLQALGDSAVDAAMEVWTEKYRENLQKTLIQQANPGEVLRQWHQQSFEQWASNANVKGAVPPVQTTVWKDGLKSILSPEQQAAYEAGEAEEGKKALEETADWLTATEGQMASSMDQTMQARLNGIFRHGVVEEDRKKQLTAAAAEAVKNVMKIWREQAEIALLQTDGAFRKKLVRNEAGLEVDMSEKKYLPQEQEVWKAAHDRILTEQERLNIGEERRRVRARRAVALAMSLLGSLDAFFSFDDTQYEKLLELAAPRMLKLPDYYFESPSGGEYYSIDIGELLNRFQTIDDARLREVLLKEDQVQRLKAVKPEHLVDNRYSSSGPATVARPAPEEMDESAAEHLLSRILHASAKEKKQRMHEIMRGRLENLRQVTQPSAETLAVLRTVAKGAAEQMAQASVTSMTQWVHNQFRNVKLADMPAKLKTFSLPRFGGNSRQEDGPALWTAALERLLTRAQQRVWQENLAFRESRRISSMTEMVMTEVDKQLPLKPEQLQMLRGKTGRIILDYNQDISGVFSTGWHLQGYYSMAPLALVPEAEMAKIFDKTQLETITERCLGNVTQYADMIQRRHNSRTGKKQEEDPPP